LAFGTILGGMTTLVGTPPNIIVSGFRAEAGLGNFGMFDFTPIGLAVAAVGVIFIAVIGWRIVPARKQSGVEGFESGAYITEVRVEEGSKSDGLALHEIEAELKDIDAQIIGIVQREVKIIAANPGRRVHAGDILMLEAEAEALKDVLSILGLKLEESVEDDEEAESKDEKSEDDQEDSKQSEITLLELVVQPSSRLVGYSAKDILLRTRYGINLLAFSREGKRSMKRLRAINFQSGDLLLMQGPPEAIAEFAADNGCVPLAQRELRIPNTAKIWQASLIMIGAIAVAALGWLPAAVSFALGV
ncbi:SLC13 family permease, partial [Pseudidiomarina aestuarii]